MPHGLAWVPRCKPLRLLELFCMFFLFILLFYTRSFYLNQPLVFSKGVLIFLFVTYGSFLILVGADVLSQLLKEPTSNIPIVFCTISATVFCAIACITLIVTQQTNTTCDTLRVRNIIGLLMVGSAVSTVVFFVDTLVVFRFSREK